MGITKFFKKHFFEEVDEGMEELHDLIYDSDDDEENEKVQFSIKRGKKEKKEKKSSSKIKARNVEEERAHLKNEEEKYNKLLDAVNQQELDKALDIDDKELGIKSFESVDIGHLNHDEIRSYVAAQCEIMSESVKHIDMAMEQYTDVAEHFADIEKFEDAPDGLKSQIIAEAERVDNLTVDRRIFKSGENKISNVTYSVMEKYENEIPKAITFLRDQEEYFENIQQDIKAVQGEQYGLRMDADTLKKRQIYIRKAAVATLISLSIIFLIFVCAIVGTGEESYIELFLVVTVLSAALALGMYAIQKNAQRQVKVTEIKLSKNTQMLNKIKIRYVNTANVINYEYEKYKVKDAYELSRKYQAYLEVKEEQKNVLEMTAKLSQAEERLLSLLGQVGMIDCGIWLGQVRALYNHNEMIEIRHEYAMLRQKLREQIVFNEGKIEEAKRNIKLLTKQYPKYTREILNILDMYEMSNGKIT